MSTADEKHDWRQHPHIADQKFCARCETVVHVPTEMRLKPLYRFSGRAYSFEEPACPPEAK